jgi:hypothetical protein
MTETLNLTKYTQQDANNQLQEYSKCYFVPNDTKTFKSKGV